MLLRLPGIEPGSLPWQGSILPLDHRREGDAVCFVHVYGTKLYNNPILSGGGRSLRTGVLRYAFYAFYALGFIFRNRGPLVVVEA